MIKRLFLSIILLFAGNAIADNADNPGMQAYVHKLMNESLAILNDDTLDNKTKTNKVKQMLSENMDSSWMARFTLGRGIKAFSPEEVKAFIEAYKSYMISSYASAVSQYKGEKVEIKAVQDMNKEFSVVKTQIIKDDGNVINVDYLVHSVSGKFEVCDVITEGISLINSQKSEYDGMIASKGIGALTQDLKSRSQ